MPLTRYAILACSSLLSGLFLGACSSSEENGNDPESPRIAAPIDAQAFWIDRRAGVGIEEILIGEAVPEERQHARDPDLTRVGRSLRKVASNGEMHDLVAALDEAGFDRHAQANPSPGAIQVIGLVRDGRERYVSILPPSDPKNLSGDEQAVRGIRNTFRQFFSQVLHLETGQMTKEDFERLQQRLNERNENRLDALDRGRKD